MAGRAHCVFYLRAGPDPGGAVVQQPNIPSATLITLSSTHSLLLPHSTCPHRMQRPISVAPVRCQFLQPLPLWPLSWQQACRSDDVIWFHMHVHMPHLPPSSELLCEPTCHWSTVSHGGVSWRAHCHLASRNVSFPHSAIATCNPCPNLQPFPFSSCDSLHYSLPCPSRNSTLCNHSPRYYSPATPFNFLYFYGNQ